MKNSMNPISDAAAASKWTIGRVTLTQGNLDNSHFYLRQLLPAFPRGSIGGSNKAAQAKRLLSIHWGGSEPAVTDIDGSKKLFRARGWVGLFFARTKARAGDSVLLVKTGVDQYQVSLERRAR